MLTLFGMGGHRAPVAEDLQCSICLEPFSATEEGRLPLQLPCKHSFCKQKFPINNDIINLIETGKESPVASCASKSEQSEGCAAAVTTGAKAAQPPPADSILISDDESSDGDDGEKQPLLPSNKARGCASSVSVIPSQKHTQGSSQPQQQAAESAGLLQRSDPQAFDEFNHRQPRDCQGQRARKRQGRGNERRSFRGVPVARKRQGEEEGGECAGGKEARTGGVGNHDLEINEYINGWVQCQHKHCGKWREHDASEEDPFVCSDMGDSCPQGCDTIEDRSWASKPAFAGMEAGIKEKEALHFSYVENAVEFLLFKLEDAKRIQSSVVQELRKLADSEDVEGAVLSRGHHRATNKSRKSHIEDKNKHEDEIAYEGYVEKLKDLLIQLESGIEDKYKYPCTPCGEKIAEWRAKLRGVSSAVDVYRLGWALEEAIKWREEEDEEKEEREDDDDDEYTEVKRGRSERSKRGRSRRKGGRGGNRRSVEEMQSQQEEEERRRVTGESSARLSREEEREPTAGAEGGGTKMVGDVTGMADHPETEGSEREPSDNCNETPSFSVALGAGGNSGGGLTDRTSTRPEKYAGDEGSQPSHTHTHAAAAPPPRLSDQCAGEEHTAAAAAAGTAVAAAATSPPPDRSGDTILRNNMYDEGDEELARRLAGSTEQHHHHHQRAVDQYIADCERSPEIGDLHSSTDSGDDLVGDKMLWQKSDDRTKEVAVGGVASSLVKEVDMNMNEMISMLEQEYVYNEEKLSVANLELDKERSNLMSSKRQIHDLKGSIEKLNNTSKDLSSQLSREENLDLYEHIEHAMKDLRTKHRSLKQAEEQKANIKNTLSSKQEKCKFIQVRLDEINENKSKVQSLMLKAAEQCRAAEQLKSDLKYSQALKVDTANRLAAVQVEYENVKAEHGALAKKCESQEHELVLRDQEAKAKENEAKRLLNNFLKKRKCWELDDHED